MCLDFITLIIFGEDSAVHTILSELFPSQVCVIGKALGYGLHDRGFRVRFLAGMGTSLFTTEFRTALGVKRAGREADHSPPSSVEANTPSWRGAQLKKAQGQLYLY
jgi:hypothetical protein